MTDYHAEVESRKDDLMKDLSELLAVPSVRDDSKATDDAPLGPGPRDALNKFAEFAERDGFTVHNIDNLVEYIEYGTDDSDDQHVALLGHVDVMPAGDGWKTDPFKAEIKDGKLYARGSSDDKGPTMAAYYAMKIIKDLNLPLKHKIRFIVGSDEENDWTGVTRYFKQEPQPLMGFSPDAEFPIINGEKGLAQLVTKFTGSNGDGIKLLSFKSGLRTNMVPGQATAVITNFDDADAIINSFNQFLEANPVKGNSEVSGDQITLTVLGKQVHGAMPETGINAGTFLANFLMQYDFGGTAKTLVDFLGGDAHDDTKGKKLGIDHVDDVMGELSFNVGIMNFAEGEESLINVNIRYPKGTDEATIISQINQHISAETPFAAFGHNQVPHYVSPDDELVKTLLRVYEERTGEKGHDQVIGGGTYGRMMKRGVAFGALFEGDEDTMHQVDEFMPVDRLYETVEIYTQAIYEMANLD